MRQTTQPVIVGVLAAAGVRLIKTSTKNLRGQKLAQGRGLMIGLVVGLVIVV
jgi:hypothetical protein